MPDTKKLLKKSIEILTDKADKCFEAAQMQHTIADKQHESAEKLVVLGHTLQDDAVELSGELEELEMTKAVAKVISLKSKVA